MRVVIYQACYMSFDDGDGRADEVEYKLRFISNVFWHKLCALTRGRDWNKNHLVSLSIIDMHADDEWVNSINASIIAQDVNFLILIVG